MNSTSLVTPSAKSHERVSGRWIRDLKAESSREWAVYYAKLVFGTPIPWLLIIAAAALFTSRAVLEISSWSLAALTTIYIFVDRFSKNREFHFFRVGYDFPLIGFVAVGIAGIFSVSTGADALESVGHLRWVILIYMFAYCWELFPGLNRVFGILIGFAVAASLYGIWQHFTGEDLLRNLALQSAPVLHSAFFCASGFFRSPETFGTILAVLLPIPAATFLQADRRDLRSVKWGALLITLIMSLALFWTYRMGIWLAAGIGVIVVTILQSVRPFMLIAALGILIFSAIVFTQESPEFFAREMQSSEMKRADLQRAQINRQVDLWQKNLWIGTGLQSTETESFDPAIGNVYFTILAQSGIAGLALFFAFIGGFLMSTYRVWQEIPRTHFWHRVFVSGGIASQVAFHASGLYWSTLNEAHTMILFVLLLASICYINEHYTRGLVPDDYAL